MYVLQGVLKRKGNIDKILMHSKNEEIVER